MCCHSGDIFQRIEIETTSRTRLVVIHHHLMKCISVDRDVLMMGSYAPKLELQSFTTPVDEAPSGKNL